MCDALARSREAARVSRHAVQFCSGSANERAVRLWKSFGFEIVGQLPDAFLHPGSWRHRRTVVHRSEDAPLRCRAFIRVLDTASLDGAGIRITEAAEAILEGGAEILQFRHKTFWNRETFAQAEKIAALCREAHALFIVNDRSRLCRVCWAAGLHLGREDLVARRRAPCGRSRCDHRLFHTQFGPDARRRIRTGRLRGFRPCLPHSIKRSPRSDGRNRRPARCARADSEAFSCDRRHHTRPCSHLLERGRGRGRHHRRSASAILHKADLARSDD